MLVVGTHLCANHTSVLTFHEIPRKLKYIEQWENTRKSWAQFATGRCRAAYSRPASITISRSPATPSGNVTHVAQQTHCNRKLANRWKIRPPGPTVSEILRSFSWCRFEISVAHFSRSSVQMMPELIQLKFWTRNLEKDEILSWKSTCA